MPGYLSYWQTGMSLLYPSGGSGSDVYMWMAILACITTPGVIVYVLAKEKSTKIFVLLWTANAAIYGVWYLIV